MKQLMGMVHSYRRINTLPLAEREMMARKSMMIFPGLVAVHKDEKQAKEFLKLPVNTNQKLFMILIKIKAEECKFSFMNAKEFVLNSMTRFKELKQWIIKER